MSIKKAELHVHLEGTITPNMARKLAKRNKLAFPDNLVSHDSHHYLSRDFLHFLQVFDTVADFIKTPRDYYDITYDYLQRNALQNTLYVEMMYSPDHAEKVSGIPSQEHLVAIEQAIHDAGDTFDITARIIITAVRHFGVDAAIRVATQAAKASIPSATGFGLGGDELNYPPGLFKRAYEIAADAGYSCTVHAGEFAPASGMVEAMDSLPIKRIGHGVQVIHSPQTMALVKERNIALELCPSSNVKLGLFKNLKEHPFPQLLNAGLRVSLNSDDPPFFGTTLAEEYERAQKTWHLSDATMTSITAMAIQSAFVDDATKKTLLAKL